MKILIYIYIFFFSLSSFASVGEPKVIWRQYPIRVCFDGWQYKSHAPFLEAIKETIMKEFAPERTIVSFTGWKKCNELSSSEYDVRIKPTGDLEQAIGAAGRSPIGDHSIYLPETGYTQDLSVPQGDVLLWDPITFTGLGFDIKPFVGRMPSKVFLSYTALHEFGHVAGLRHEHLHFADVPNDQKCNPQLIKKFEAEKPATSTHFYGDYDSYSVMNYCWYNYIVKNGLSDEVKLSDGDIKTLRQMYSVPHR